MNRLQSEFELKKKLLQSVVHDIKSMEKELAQRNLRYKAVPVLPSVSRLIKVYFLENRALTLYIICDTQVLKVQTNMF